MTPHATRTVVAIVSAFLALGCAALAIGHAGFDVPVLSRFGPGGNRPIVPVAVAFAVATIALASVTFGALRGRAWSWALGLVVHGLIFLGAAVPFRGVASLVAIVLSGAAVALLLSRPGRRALFAH